MNVSTPLRASITKGETIYSMSRHSTPAEAFGRLNLRASESETESSDMPPQTRSGTKRARGLDGRQASSGGDASAGAVVAGPSRPSVRRRAPPSRTSRRSGRAPARAVAEEEDDDDDDDDDEGGGEDGGDHERRFGSHKRLLIAEMFCIYTDGYLTPLEFLNLRQQGNGSRNHRLRRFAEDVAEKVTSVADLQAFRTSMPLEFCCEQMVSRLSLRWSSIQSNLHAHILDASRGYNVPDTLRACEALVVAASHVILRHPGPNALTDANKSGIADVLGNLLSWIASSTGDVYEGSDRTQPAYASQATMVPYQAFVNGRPLELVQALNPLPDDFLRLQRLRDGIYYLFGRAWNTHHGQPWTLALQLIYNRAMG